MIFKFNKYGTQIQYIWHSNSINMTYSNSINMIYSNSINMIYSNSINMIFKLHKYIIQIQ